MSLSCEEVKKLTAPFPKDVLGVKVQSLSKNKDRALLVLYLQHTDVMNRLEEVDPAWSAEAVEVRDASECVFVRMKMTLKGVTRENVGEGNDPKSAYSDALKRCAMLFGVGRYLYDSEQAWVPYNESQDRFRQFTIAEYEGALRPGQAKVPGISSSSAPSSQAPKSVSKPQAQGPAPAPVQAMRPAIKTKNSVGQEILKVARALKLSGPELEQWVDQRYQKQTKDLSLPELEEFYNVLLEEAGRNGVAV